MNGYQHPIDVFNVPAFTVIAKDNQTKPNTAQRLNKNKSRDVVGGKSKEAGHVTSLRAK